MTLIPMKKQWDIDANNVGGIRVVNLEDHQRTLFALKEALVGNGSGELSNPMTVIASSDSVTADASDNWTTHTDLVWNNVGVAHSWIVLEFGAGGAQVCIDCQTTFPRLIEAVWSPAAGFTGGTTTNRPTATDEQPINSVGGVIGWLGQNTGVGTYMVHVWGSQDGESYRAAIYFTAASCASFLIFEKVSDQPPNNVTPPWHGYVMQWIYPTSATGHCQRTNGANGPVDNNRTRTEHDGNNLDIRLTGEGQGASLTATASTYVARAAADITDPNQMSLAWDLQPVGVYCNETPLRGRLGTLADVWWVPADPGPPNVAGRNDGDFLPEDDDPDGGKQVVILGFMALPWKASLGDLRLGYWEP